MAYRDQNQAYQAVAQVLLELKALRYTPQELAQALVRAANEAGIQRFQFGEAYDDLRL